MLHLLKLFLISGEVENRATVNKIYDIDPTCPTAKEFYEKVCQDGCDLVATRSF